VPVRRAAEDWAEATGEVETAAVAAAAGTVTGVEVTAEGTVTAVAASSYRRPA
jgi:hypothetical protein